jgi:hypothetical protein
VGCDGFKSASEVLVPLIYGTMSGFKWIGPLISGPTHPRSIVGLDETFVSAGLA